MAVSLVATTLTFSPAFTYLAQPLVISSSLQHANAIVILGGGVERDGRPTRGTLERTLYGVTLYQRGLADTLILSTGVTKGFNEARLMAKIARAQGVPERALILEELSHNTHENIHEVQKILAAHHWRQVIVVSSPYHMKRVSLVYQHCCQETSVLYAPANLEGLCRFENPLHRFRQARAVYREYLGIGWYWVRGYV